MKKLLLAASIVSIASQAQAAVINWASGGGRGHMIVTDTVTNTRVADGSLVRVGYFQEAGNVASPFVEFGTTTLGSPGGGVSGGILPAAGRSITGADTFAGRQLYVWIYNAANAATATAQEIFTSVTWTTPANFNTPDATFNITMGQTAEPIVAVTNLQGPGDIDQGSYGQGSVTIAGTANSFASVYSLGVTIPEPATSLMASIAALGLLVRRRR